MTIHRTIIAAAFALTVAGAAQADGLRPVEGRSIDLGDVSGIAYYTVEPDGFRVVATVAQGEAGTPVRLEAVLAPNQSVVLSSPRVGSVAPNAIEISRRRRSGAGSPGGSYQLRSVGEVLTAAGGRADPRMIRNGNLLLTGSSRPEIDP